MDDDLRAALAADLDGSFERLVRTHQDLVFGVARRLGSRPEDAEEIAQDAFLRAHRALRSYPAERILDLRLRGWLVRICINVLRNRHRAQAPRLVPLPDDDSPSPLRDGADPTRRWERREEAVEWGALVASLPERYRAPVVLRHVEGLPYGEVATALALPVGTVKAQVHRGVAMLRERLMESQAARAAATEMGRSRRASA